MDIRDYFNVLRFNPGCPSVVARSVVFKYIRGMDIMCEYAN